MSLAALQAGFQAYVLRSRDEPGPVLALLEGGFGISRERRAAIYHHAYRARLREALGSVFERTWAYLGDDEFDAAAARFIEANPPRTRNLRDYGQDFPASLREALPGDPEVAELATMDWNLHAAFDAPDCAPLDPARLGELREEEWAGARFELHPGVSLAVFEWNALALWHAIDQGGTPPPAARLPRPTGHLFWRSALASRFRSLDEAEHAALRDLAAGVPFARICEATTPGEAGEWLRTWLADELIVGLSTGG